MVISPTQVSVQAGATFSVTVVETTDRATSGAQFGLKFNAAVLQCASVNEGTFYSNWAAANGGQTQVFPQAAWDNTGGRIDDTGIFIVYRAGSTASQAAGGPSGSGVFFTLNFTVKADGTSPLTLVDVVINDDDTAQTAALQVATTSGQVTVGATPTPGPSDTPGATEEEATALAAGTAGAGGAAITATLAAGTGTPVPGALAAGTPGAVAGATAANAVSGAPGAGPGANGTQGAGTGILSRGSKALPGRGASGLPGSQAGADDQGGEGAGGSASSVAFDLSGELDKDGVLKQDVELQAGDGLAALRIGQGTQALTADNLPLRAVTITVLADAPAPEHGQSLVSAAYELDPEGAVFDTPPQLILAYDPKLLPKGVRPASLSAALYDPDAKSWKGQKSKLDLSGATIVTPIEHFSTYAILAPPQSAGVSPLILGSTAVEVLAVAGGVVFYLRRRRARNFGPSAYGSGRRPYKPLQGQVLLLPPPRGAGSYAGRPRRRRPMPRTGGRGDRIR
jgi:hypothetical protein